MVAALAAASPLDALGRRARMLFWLAVGALVFNLLDGVLTLAGVWSGLATEANPLLAELVSRSPTAFMLVKLSLVSLGVTLLSRLAHNVWAAGALALTVVVYGSVVLFLHAPALPAVLASFR